MISQDYTIKITDFGLSKALIATGDQNGKVWLKVTGTRGQVSSGCFFDKFDRRNMPHMRGMWAPELKRAQDRLLEKDSWNGE